MVHKEFLLLSEDGQYEVVQSKGGRMAEQADSGYRYTQHQVYSFYIEVKTEIKKEEIKSIVSFSSTAPLDRYTDTIGLPF